jgi:hypothetical protein
MKPDERTRKSDIAFKVWYTKERLFLVFRMVRPRKNNRSTAAKARMVFRVRPRLPTADAGFNPSMKIETCPAPKKDMRKSVAIRIAFLRSETSRKLIAQMKEATAIESTRGRMITMASTSRKFEVSNARLGYTVNKNRK